MNVKKEAKKIIKELEINNLYAICPCCDEAISLKDAGLFYLDEFTPEAMELYNDWQDDLKQRERALKERGKSIPEISQIITKSVNIGNILERMVPTMTQFAFERSDCRSLFDPIDYLIFEGLTKKGVVTKMFFIDIKTGKARLAYKQKEIKQLIEFKRVEWCTYERNE